MSKPLITHPRSDAGRSVGSDPATLAAFLATALLSGGNAVAIRLGNLDLAPFWGAALRFVPAALILLVVVAVMRLELPRGRAALGVVAYGIFSFGLGFGFGYLALREVTAGTGQWRWRCRHSSPPSWRRCRASSAFARLDLPAPSSPRPASS